MSDGQTDQPKTESTASPAAPAPAGGGGSGKAFIGGIVIGLVVGAFAGVLLPEINRLGQPGVTPPPDGTTTAQPPEPGTPTDLDPETGLSDEELARRAAEAANDAAQQVEDAANDAADAVQGAIDNATDND